ncbi:Rho-binding antiterminator [Sedimenticola thiotaurini]|uniref:Uncharacterized protein n=1 Tax=Sedimenticola thiotaurini TaxID=1543721 RepID=A0A0F7JX93_9GAMM|nr:Rho-binding antiterminator [Sedimenticola thiotaurini]AKH19415.1 hypothetical protein AAY24_02570 [Sedimenticola thiotaurini]
MISCAQHDYVEIACLYRMGVILTLRSGEVLRGIAVDTARNQAGEECLKLSTGSAEALVVLDQVRQMEAAEENPHFATVDF